ncbi:Hint domain-containing protein [uncultured Roseobacter sp.]|uniref:Hint domain-containing protein n=1 Tax=uncultured Roseobacter sp. TaxID=114847 RepID=UPI0026245FF6|nr:Hint domain-containing protein [uncultured Roseobacter sp.]
MTAQGSPGQAAACATRQVSLPPENLSPGLVHGARVLTLRGEMPVQALVPGDRLVSPGAVMAEVNRIEVSSVITRGIYVIAGSLGHTRRSTDTLLAAGQPVLIRDWRAAALTGRRLAWLPAIDLVDGEFVRDIGLAPMTLYRVICDGPRVICADGMELGSAEVAALPVSAGAR